jgi:DNA-directed RNA polymerase specialized sigma24 family protein
MKTKGGEFKDIEWALDNTHYLFDILKPREQFIVAMHFCCGWPYHRIAEYEGITINCVKQIMFRINKKAKRLHLGQHIDFVTTVQELFKSGV